ncbi:heavy metal-binding domain-containing protein [Hymenobacter aerophilus]|uniref:heavy metal-binding domain-containing protein n=1 Tax=Hymenobacter aerophilus TaxID=119644 RepID=UPI00037E38D9|nr:heavy metal-binding domain-containing protein [Hymenobacter aerophilus]
MKHLKKALLTLCLLPALGLLSSCEQQAATTETPAATTTEAPAATSPEAVPASTAAYICPMNCEGSASDKPGKCPVCKMDLEPNPAAAPAATL